MCEAFGAAPGVWYTIYRIIVANDVTLERTTRYVPLVIPVIINMLRPAIASHKKPKKAVMILEWL
jgi:hypothetical protein